MKKGLCVFDKFTGDGMLRFFPDFYSGRDFGFRALQVATLCHKAFERIYEDCRPYFDTVLLDTGLGIGIDYGNVQLMRVPDGLTVVGRPVVYACRLSGAPAGKTYVNQSARNQLVKAYPHQVRFEWRDYTIKNEGRIAVSELIELQPFEPSIPDWLEG
jgi:class 3 adenylate cyclase